MCCTEYQKDKWTLQAEVCWTSKSNLGITKSATKIIPLAFVNLVTLKAGAKHEL
jgi:hypothetical protein